MSDEFISRRDVQFYTMTIIKELEKLYNTGCLGIADLDWRVLMEQILSVDNLPAADVVPVVRCKDCMHYDCSLCAHVEHEYERHEPDYFCADGEMESR